MNSCEICGELVQLLTPLDIDIDGDKRHLLVCQDCVEDYADGPVPL